MNNATAILNATQVDETHRFYTGQIPRSLHWDQDLFDEIFAGHPAERNWIKMHGKSVQIPRHQQAFGATYHFSGQDNEALPISVHLRPLLDWVQLSVDPRLNGLLLNYYTGRDEYIGQHRDSIRDLVPGSPIVTVSFGEERVFRLSPGKSVEGKNLDFAAFPGSVFVIPWDLNKKWKHGVPKRARYHSRRISVTFRAFENGVLPPEQYFESPRPAHDGSSNE